MSIGHNELGHLLEVAHELAIEAGAVTLKHFGTVLASDTKGDGTPVTEADRAAETLMRERIGAQFPTHGILGEEFGKPTPGHPFDGSWILSTAPDPSSGGFPCTASSSESRSKAHRRLVWLTSRL